MTVLGGVTGIILSSLENNSTTISPESIQKPWRSWRRDFKVYFIRVLALVFVLEVSLVQYNVCRADSSELVVFILCIILFIDICITTLSLPR